MPIRPYEIVYIIDPDVQEEGTAALVERFRALAEAQGAQELRVDTHTLGKRRLAYVIDHKREGQYVVMNFQSEANAPAELDRVLHITDGILRSMVVRLEEMPPEPPPPPAPPVPAPAVVAETPAEPAPEPVEAPTEEAPAAEEPAAEAAQAEVAPLDDTPSDEAAPESAGTEEASPEA